MEIKRNKKLLVVYNVCQLTFRNWSKENVKSQVDYWIQCIDSLLAQNHDNFDIIISGCAIRPETKNILMGRFKNKVSYNFIDKTLTCFITMNKAIELMIQHKEEYDGYVYIDSGVDCGKTTTILSEMDKRGQNGNISIVAVDVDNDGGRDMIFGSSPGIKWTENPGNIGKDLIVPIGRLQNMHFQYFHRSIKDAYGKVLPDVHRTGGIEWLFSYMAAALHTNFVILQDVIVHHATAFDGGSAGFPVVTEIPMHYDFLYGLTCEDIFYNDEARACGFGYDDLFGFGNVKCLLHNPNLFTPEGYAVKAEELKNFLKTHFYLQPDRFDYSKIQCEFVGN
jgi:hypothetical protein